MCNKYVCVQCSTLKLECEYILDYFSEHFPYLLVSLQTLVVE